MRIRCESVEGRHGYNIILFNGKLLDGKRKGHQVMFSRDARMAVPIVEDLDAGEQPVCIVEDWQVYG